MKNDIFKTADILLPENVPMESWSVIACDQFSSERSFWERVRDTVGDKPSTFCMVLPEAYLGTVNEEDETAKIADVMDKYLKDGIFKELTDSFIYIERTISDGRVRRGLLGVIDLEEYDFSGGKAAILASEGTVLDRLPPRVRVRRSAQLELPHAMAFIDDKEKTVIEPLAKKQEMLPVLYDFKLMEGGGHIKGFRVFGDDVKSVLSAMCKLCEKSPALMIIGDGNHSLAAAKVYWDELKQGISPENRAAHPARYALLEVNNVYDPAVSFEAIHRVLFGVDADKFAEELREALPPGKDYILNWRSGENSGSIGIAASCIGDMLTALQSFIDEYVSKTGCTVDYIHGDDTAAELSVKPDSFAIILPAMDKSDFFETVTVQGVFPRKSFSVGHARDKRYYLECRRIQY